MSWNWKEDKDAWLKNPGCEIKYTAEGKPYLIAGFKEAEIDVDSPSVLLFMKLVNRKYEMSKSDESK